MIFLEKSHILLTRYTWYIAISNGNIKYITFFTFVNLFTSLFPFYFVIFSIDSIKYFCFLKIKSITIDKYLDNCYLAGLNQVSIVHGKGTGALRKGIHAFLKTNPHVKSFRLGTFGEGEMGVTIVELK